MKIFRDDVCYVSFKDLVGSDFPLSFDKENYDEFDYVKLTEQKDIDYIKGRDDILDYDIISQLDDGALSRKIKSVERSLTPYYQKVNASLTKDRLKILKDKKFKDKFFKLEKKYNDLIFYKNYRDEEDKRVIKLLDVKTLKKRP